MEAGFRRAFNTILDANVSVMIAAISEYTCCQNAVVAAEKFVCSAGVFNHAGLPSGYRCATPAAVPGSP